MFKCEFCNKVTAPREVCTLITTATHEVTQRGGKVTTEIKVEKRACPTCAKVNEMAEAKARLAQKYEA